MTSLLNTKVTKRVSLISILTVLRTGPNDLGNLHTVSRLPANVYLDVLPGDKAAEACSCPATQKHLESSWRIYVTSCRPLVLLDGDHGVMFYSAFGQIYFLNYSWSTWCHLLYYFIIYLLLNMFRMLVHPSSGACDLFVDLLLWFDVCWCYGVYPYAG